MTSKNKAQYLPAAVAVLMMPALVLPVKASTPQPFLTGFALNSPPTRQDFSGFVGMQFTVGAMPLSVSSLGRVCISGNSQTHIVKLVSASTKTDVPGATAQVNMAGCSGGQFTYTNLAGPVTLLASTTYYLVSQEFANSGEYWYDSGSISSRADAAVITSVFLSGGSWVTPGTANTSYVPPDMKYVTLTPSAASFVLNYNQNNQPVRNDFTGFAGMTLNIGLAPLNVTSVGRVCVAGNSQTHTVKFVDAATGSDVPGGGASVNMQNCTASQFVYANLASTLTLAPSKSYYLVSSETSGGDSWYGQSTLTTMADASVPGAVYSPNGTSWIPQPGVNTSYVPPNFQYSTGVIVPPVPVSVTLGTSPSGLSITVDGTNYTSPKTFNWNSGDSHIIAATSPQTLASSQYVFGSWSDGGTQSHSVTVTPGTTSYTATFTLQAAQFLLTTSVSPAGSGTVSGGGVFYTAGTSAQIVATANTGYTFLNWTGAVTSPTSATTTIAMNSAQSVTANFVASGTSAQILQDHKATITGFFAFVSYDDPTKVTFILNVDPLLEPGNGPAYFPFDDNVQYSIKIDNNNAAAEDIVFQFQFTTQINAPGVFSSFLGAGAGINAPANSPAPVAPGTPIVPPAITALSGAGAAGLSVGQTYTVTMIKGGVSTPLTNAAGGSLFAVPTNVGPRTMPNYLALAAQGIYSLGSGIRVFAGTTDEPSFADLGGVYDTFNFRTAAGGGVLSAAADADDHTNTAADFLSGYNVNSIAIEVPITMLTRSGALEASTSTAATIGAWGTTARPSMVTLQSPLPPIYSGSFSQIQRMGNPLISDFLIGLGSKNKWAMSAPVNDSQFASFYLDPLLAREFNAIYGIAIPTPPRTDLLPLIAYAPPIAAPGTPAGPIADLLRLNTGVPPTPMGSRKRLGLLAGDAAGFPNGRRVSDDVGDIMLRSAAGILAGPQYNYPIGDGVNTNDIPFQETFPYLGWAQSGRQRRHIDPGEPGCTMGAGAACPTN